MSAWADVFPLLLFFVAYKLRGIYVATAVAIVATVIATGYKFRREGKVEPLPLFGLLLMIVLGGLTIYFKDQRFIIFKPTLAYVATALFFALSCRPGQVPLLETMMGAHLNLPRPVWQRATWGYVAFFSFQAVLNLAVGFTLSFDTWVQYKVFGALILSFVFMGAHLAYYSRYQVRLEKDSTS